MHFFKYLFILFFPISTYANVAFSEDVSRFFNKNHPSCFLLKNLNSGQIYVFNDYQCNIRENPYSTFKVLHSLIALETNVIIENRTIIPWDGKKKFLKSWEKDHNLESALRFSVLPFYQEVARRIGRERMLKYIKKTVFGNGEIGLKIDRFRLDGPLKVTGFEQLKFLEKLYEENLPFEKAHQKFVKKILNLHMTLKGYSLSGKTGSRFNSGHFRFGWFIGHMKKSSQQYLLVISSKGEDESGQAQIIRLQKIIENLKFI